MIIQADQEGQKAIIEIADAALKALGLQAHAKVGQLLNSIKPLEDVLQAKEPVVENKSPEPKLKIQK